MSGHWWICKQCGTVRVYKMELCDECRKTDAGDQAIHEIERVLNVTSVSDLYSKPGIFLTPIQWRALLERVKV